MASGIVGIWVSSTSFQKSNIGWPQQPPTEKVLNFNTIFHDPTKKLSFSKNQNKAEFKNLDDSEVLSSDFSDLRTSAASVTSTASTTSVASMTSSASFHQKNYWAWCFHQPWHQNDLLMWDGSSKTQYFIDFWHISFWRLWRTWMLLLTKSKGHR